jgi:hypothetical protein
MAVMEMAIVDVPAMKVSRVHGTTMDVAGVDVAPTPTMRMAAAPMAVAAAVAAYEYGLGAIVTTQQVRCCGLLALFQIKLQRVVARSTGPRAHP